MTERIIPQPDPLLAPDNSSSSAYEASRLVKALPGVLYGFAGYNSGPDQFIQVHDAASLPGNTAVPLLVWKISATSNFAFDAGPYGLGCKTGIVICNSTTGPTKTLGANDCFITAVYK